MSSSRHRERAALGAGLRFSFATAATTWAAMWSWRGFTDVSVRFLYALLLIGAVVAATGALARWRRLPGAVVLMTQAVAGAFVTCLYVAGTAYPGGAFWDELGAAVDAANTYASPVPSTDTIDVQPLLIVGGLLAMLLVDVCAGTLRRVPLAGLPLLTVYSVPVSLLGDGLSWWVFAATAGGFLLMLFFQEEEHLSRWGRSLDGTGEPLRRVSDSVRASALGVGAAATAAAVLLPLAIPTFSFSVFEVGSGQGGGGDIDITNPMVDLRRDLTRGPNVPVMRIRTTDTSPDHLRISVLNRFTNNEWSAGDRDVPTSNLAQGAMPPLEGVEEPIATQVGSFAYDVEVLDTLQSRWLPTQAPISEIRADGDWRFDPSTMDFLASDDDLSTAGMDYSFTAVDLDYDTDRLLGLETSSTSVDDELTDLPDDFPDTVRQLASRTVSGATTSFQEAVLLQQFFREDGNFQYTLDNVPPQVGTNELEDFLRDDKDGRQGYCEQFAAAMGVMARSLGIPARLAVGFLRPTGVSDEPDTVVYMSHDLHAWVELYFPGAGWVLFDPTPPARVDQDTLPAYTTAEVAPQIPTSGPAVTETREPSARPPVDGPTSAPTTAPDQAADTGGSGDRSSTVPWVGVLVVAAVLALLVLLLLVPRSVRTRQRTRRLDGGPEAAWEELRAVVVDLRRTWPEGRSPRETFEVVVRWFGRVGDTDTRPATGAGLAPDAVDAFGRVVDQVERVRYARRFGIEPGVLADDVLLVSEALAAGVTPRLRRRAAWLPASAFQRRAAVEDLEGEVDAEPELAGSRVEHI